MLNQICRLRPHELSSRAQLRGSSARDFTLVARVTDSSFTLVPRILSGYKVTNPKDRVVNDYYRAKPASSAPSTPRDKPRDKPGQVMAGGVMINLKGKRNSEYERATQ